MHGQRCEGNAAHAAPRKLTAAQVFDLQQRAVAASGCVVHVETQIAAPADALECPGEACAAALSSGGTGVVIDGSGLILTNEHVVRNARRVSVVLPNDTRCAAVCWAVDDYLDLAIIQVEAGTLPALAVCGEQVGPGMPVVAVGRIRANAAVAARTGVVAATSASLQRELDPTGTRSYDQLIAVTAPLEAGFSGSPLLNLRGQFVGLAVATRGVGGSRRAYAIPFTASVRGAVARLRAKLAAASQGRSAA